jgi:hypothetical protein
MTALEPIAPKGRSLQHLDYLIGLILASLALLWCLYYGLHKGSPVGDEVQAAVTAFHILHDQGFMPFLVGQDYMGTIQEYVMAGMMMLSGVNELVLRLPSMMFFAAAVFITYVTISREVSGEIALASGILMVATNSAVTYYTALGVPDYGAATFLGGAIAWQTFRVDRLRSWGQWALLGALGGLGAYLFQILILQTMASMAFLAARSTLSGRFRPVARNRSFGAIVACGVVGGILLLAVAYHFLTRRATYVAGLLDLALLCGGLLFGGVFVILLARVLKPSHAEWVSSASFAIVFAAFLIFPNLWFRYHELPSLVADHVPLWQAGTYSLKQAREWVTDQPGLLFNYVLPRLAVGRIGSIPELGTVSGPFPIDAVGWISALVALVFVVLLVRHFQLQKRPMLACPESVFILPFFLLVLVLFPSWNLFGPWSYRYPLPFLPGLCLGLVIALNTIVKGRLALFSVVGAYALYSGYDCLANSRYVAPNQDCVVLAARLLEEQIDGALVGGPCSLDLAWRTAGRVWVADTGEISQPQYLYPRPSRIATLTSIAVVDLDPAKLARILGGSAGDFTVAETLSPGVLIYRRKSTP